MKQLNVFCEGPTEQGFCKQVLQPHLFSQGGGLIHTLPIGDKDHHHVYGIGSRNKYEKVRKFIFNTIKQRSGQNVYFTTLIDLYALPSEFPGKAANVRNAADPNPYVIALESAFGADINYFRFVPYLQLYEFESILFADPEAFAWSFENCTAEIQQLKAIAASVPTVEHIDDGRNSAPSKRIISLIPEYEGRKASAGPDIAEYIGISEIRAKCPHFSGWVARLEGILWDDE